MGCVDAFSLQASDDGCGHQWMHKSFVAGEGRDGVNLQAGLNDVDTIMVMELRNARTLITGGTTGVGAALVNSLHQAGSIVVTCGHDQDRCATLRSRHPGVHVVEIDLATPGAARRLVEEAVGTLGGLDMVINNAAVQVHESFVPMPADGIAERIDNEIAVNLAAPIEITAAAMPALVGSKAAALVYITSGLAVFPKKSAPVYCATKSALRTFAAAVRYQLSDDAAHVTVIDAVLPLVDTPMTAGRESAGAKMSPDAVAARIVDAIVRSKPTVYIGKARLLPWLVRLAPSIGRRALRNS